MPTKPIYIEWLKLQNVRTFGKEVELRLTKPDGTIPHWTLILGDNGVGKTTLLQCIALLKPEIKSGATNAPENTSETHPYTYAIDRDSGFDLSTLLKNNLSKSTSSHIYSSYRLFEPMREIKGANLLSNIIRKGSKVKVSYFGEELDKHEALSKNLFRIYAYSASREPGARNLSNLEDTDTIKSFLEEQSNLLDTENILHLLNYVQAAAKEEDKPKHKLIIQKIKAMLATVLPNVKGADGIEITPPTFDDKGNIVAGTIISCGQA